MNTKPPASPAINLVDCGKGEISDSTFVGVDYAVNAVRTEEVHFTSNTVISSHVAAAIAARDSAALIAYMGLPSRIQPVLVGEALRNFADNHADEKRALAELRESRLARSLGAAADLTALSQFFLHIIQSGLLPGALSILLASV